MWQADIAQNRVVQADQPKTAHGQDVQIGGGRCRLPDLLASGRLSRVDPDDLGECGEVERRAAGRLLTAGCEPEQMSGVVRQVEAISDPLVHVETADFSAAVDDLVDSGLGKVYGCRDPSLACAAVLLNVPEYGAYVSRPQRLADVSAFPCPRG